MASIIRFYFVIVNLAFGDLVKTDFSAWLAQEPTSRSCGLGGKPGRIYSGLYLLSQSFILLCSRSALIVLDKFSSEVPLLFCRR